MSSGPAKVDVDDLEIALEFASVGEAYGNQAFVSVKTGLIFFKSDDLGPQEDAPADLETSDEFLCVPNKRELDLGRDLVFAFVEENLPDKWVDVREFFRRRGAYAKFKDMLASCNMLEAWYSFEATRTREALRRWCEDNGLELAEAGK
jgi:hypothetical protein